MTAPASGTGTPGQAAYPLLCDNRPVMDALMQALNGPGKFLNRAPLESHVSWQRRAIIEHVAPLIIDAFEESDHRQPLSVAVRALRAIAWGTTPDGKPIDPSVVADKALTEMRLADEEATAEYTPAVTAAAAAQGARSDAELPAPAQGIDPNSIEYRVRAHAFNALTRAIPEDMFMILSDRQLLADAVVAAIEPIIRADEREQPAPGAGPDLSDWLSPEDAAYDAPAPGDDESLSGHVTVRFPADMAAWVKQFAAAEGMTVSAWIRREVEREAGRREQPAPGVTVARLRAAVEARVSYADQHVIDCDAAELWEVIAEELGKPAAEAAPGDEADSGDANRQYLAKLHRDIDSLRANVNRHEELRQAIRDLAAQVQASADATRPSRKSQIEDEIAAQLRALLEDK